MAVINFGQSVSLQEFAHGVGTVGGDVTIIGQVIVTGKQIGRASCRERV